MKIGFDAKRAFLNKRGLGEYSRDIISCVTDNKNDIFLFTPGIGKNFFKKNNKHKIVLPKYKNHIYKLYWRNKGIIKDIKKHNIEIYHGLSNELPYGIHKLNVKKITTIHDVTFKKHPELFSRIQRNIYDKKTKYACKVSDVIVAVSKQTKKDIIKYYNIEEEKIKVVYQSCDDIFFKQHKDRMSKNNELYVIYVGAIEKRKNIEIIVKSVEELIEEGLEIKLIIVSPELVKHKRLNKEIKEKTIHIKHNKKIIWHKTKKENFIKIMCQLDRKDLHGLYQHSIALIQPSIDEGFGRPVLEALASKTNVIASKVEVFKEIGENNIKYFNNKLELKQQIKKILKSGDYGYYNKNFNKKKELECLGKFQYGTMKKNINELYK